MEPVARGWCSYTDMIDGTLSLWDVHYMNDAIAVRDENLRRAELAAKEK